MNIINLRASLGVRGYRYLHTRARQSSDGIDNTSRSLSSVSTLEWEFRIFVMANFLHDILATFLALWNGGAQIVIKLVIIS
jgi:hypothetical protein